MTDLLELTRRLNGLFVGRTIAEVSLYDGSTLTLTFVDGTATQVVARPLVVDESAVLDFKALPDERKLTDGV